MTTTTYADIPYEELLEARRASGVPMYNDNKMKLGIFGSNCSHGLMATHAESSYELTWEHTQKIAQLADKLGFEAMLPVARYRGMGGETNFNGTNFETHTWAAGLAQATENIMVFSTIHVPTKHPIVAAKESVTVDHISNGRHGLNMTMGWYKAEMEMFGGTQREHDARYRYGSEWITIAKRMWTEGEGVDFKGEFFEIKDAFSDPKPIQKPYPVLVNAGNSPAGLEFCARECDFNFIAFATPEEAKDTAARVRSIAHGFGRDLGILSYGNIICRDTEKETKALLNHILDKGDWEVAKMVSKGLGTESGSFDKVKALQERFILGYGGYPLIGTPEQIVDQMIELNKAGVNGMMVGFLDYVEELQYFGERVLPLMKEAGLRQ
ncbi:LLM class flavin-dependent oxidoreductase [Saccharomonospora viridis]|jgi:FMNH2-dependent dimethyl sulfone monooxygenase|uniref:Flavin-dependent oxidoreductase, F420-dependent methylene-tetrahydromethanopterin reductase n=2 Tax=Saccharomonospora viridis TaxID=1852 RepID=C7N064_SACVD|nr:LLM class flavin-dependent oxidoreductase [Saccharomonospora viridis]ACU97600.1 flavin-dependent oxidoreductase, F420-dependent methylene-tetrahydromethanopterin reductase [Saccharomonospora viridis DSM 43017]KHF42137.1 methylene-tetrahydromethanopterin reductase [Saccharomonospora viridis]SFP48368.1 Flavin-dependent oxidoreductase, luciferase family (includes alkanesulfonate monooxygenase SsuD and methylene tetrahydromethanopterin reductase) [Saccharomonospora viridis]